MSCCVVALIGMTVNAVEPSSDTSPSGASALNGTTGGRTCSTEAISSASVAIVCWSASVRPPSRW